MSQPLNAELCQELASSIETLTHTGQKVLDPNILKQIKMICKSDNGYVEHAYHLLHHQLSEPHSEVRFSAFQIIDELFRRSHYFRELLVSDMQHIIELTIETNPALLLPPPKAVARSLKSFALRSIHQWNSQFGTGYKKLQIGYNFLKKCKNIDFTSLEFENAIEQERRQERLRKEQIISKGKIKQTMAEYNDLKDEIRNAITSLENCIELLVPSLEEFFIPFENTDDIFNEISTKECLLKNECTNNGEGSIKTQEYTDINIREHGMNVNFSVAVEIKPDSAVKETTENAPIFENARDLCRIIQNRYLPDTKKWLQALTKYSGQPGDIKSMVNLKEALEKCLKKCDQLNLRVSSNTDDSSDSDLEEVPEKEGYEDHVICSLPCPEIDNNPSRLTKETKNDWSIFSKENNEKDPTTYLSTLNTLERNAKNLSSQHEEASEQITCRGSIGACAQKEQSSVSEPEITPSTSSTSKPLKSRKEKLLTLAPKLPFDIDLYHWEEENLTAPTILVKPVGARFWSATSTDEMEEVTMPEGAATLRTRVIEFSGQHEPVKWACRAPLPSGKLCPRRDREKCPFHGPIVARDENGKCSNPEDEARLKFLEEEEKQRNPEWQDPQLLQEIKEATGVDLKMPEKGKRKKKEETKYPGLTDVKAEQNSSYARLAKKVFNKRAVKRVAQNLDKADHKRYRDKFGDQFNYA